MNLFNSFEQWRAAITGPCGITLTQDYCEGRVRALNNPAEPSTKAFVEAYGETSEPSLSLGSIKQHVMPMDK